MATTNTDPAGPSSASSGGGNQGPVPLSTVPRPEITATLSPAKEEISYRWIIHSARDVLSAKRGDFILWSPIFTPKRSVSSQKLTWRLGFVRGGSGNVFICLHQNEELNLNDQEILISTCTFTLLDFKNNNCRPVSVNCSSVKKGKCASMRLRDFGPDAEVTFAIQVNATILFPSSITMVLHDLTQDKTPLHCGLKTLFDNELFVDTTIKCGEREFKVHKAVLAAQSPVFKSMFEADMRETQLGLIEIPDTEPEVISDMLSFLYTGRAPNMETMAGELLVIANKYQILELFAQCEKKLKSGISDMNILQLLVLADMHDALSLKKACLNFYYRYSNLIHRTEEWKEFKEKSQGHSSLLIDIMEYTP